MPGRVLEVRDPEARVVLGLASGVAHDLGLDDDAPALLPSAGRIAGLAAEVFGLARGARQAPGGAHQACGATLQNLVLGHSDDVLESLALEEGEELGTGKAAVQAHPQTRARKGRPQLGQQAREDPDGADRGRGIAGTQHIGKQILLGLRVEAQEPGRRQIAPAIVVSDR